MPADATAASSRGIHPALASPHAVVLVALGAGVVWGSAGAFTSDTSLSSAVSAATLLCAVLLAAWRELRASDELWSLARGAVSGALLAAGPLALFAQALKTSTHHRPLGAATFAVAAMIVIVGSTLMLLRLFGVMRGRSSTFGVVIWVPACGSFLFALWRALGADAAWLVDCSVGAGALCAAARGARTPGLVPVAERLRRGTWLTLLVLGGAAIGLTPARDPGTTSSLPFALVQLVLTE